MIEIDKLMGWIVFPKDHPSIPGPSTFLSGLVNEVSSLPTRMK